MAGNRTALIVVVPEAEHVVANLRLRLDPITRRGIPAHVTVLFPFMPQPEIDEAVIARLTDLFRAVPAFEYQLARTERFGEAVLWLAPEPDDGFRRLTDLVGTAFPVFPPYEGAFDDVVPHLTIADGAPTGDMQHAEMTVRSELPIRAVTREVTLMAEQSSGQWQRAATFGLKRKGSAWSIG